MDSLGNSDLKSLINLLNLGDNTDSDDDDYSYGSATNMKSPHSFAYDINLSRKCNTENCRKKEYDKYIAHKPSKNIWSDDEVVDEDYDEAEMKERPEYEMVYQQSVTPNDIFLQMDGKGPGSNSCEGLLIKIKLPGTFSRSEITLKISSLTLICKTKKYYLDLDFPRHVDPEKCSAKWNQQNSLLVVQLYFGKESSF